MSRHIRKLQMGIVWVLAILGSAVYGQTRGTIHGIVTDAITGNGLPGANVYLEGTSIGTATDGKGRYAIRNMMPGMYQLNVRYIGYKGQQADIRIKPGQSHEQNFMLAFEAIEGEDVVITAQAEGNYQAINQQISAPTIVNIVSSSKIQELPEANAAEAVGRLPGVALQREGGEGNKVVIRGLSPRYSKVKIEGVSMAATDDADRSTDLSMISPYMLDGIELSKAASADQEADQLGGSVNFKLREAPAERTLNTVLQSGYNGLREKLGDYKLVVSGSDRFLNQKFGLFANVDIERRNRGDHSVNAGYEMQAYDGVNYAIANSVGFQDVDRIRDRLGGTLVMDYKLPATKVKLFSTFNQYDNETRTGRENLNFSNTGDLGRQHAYIGIYNESKAMSWVNALDVEHYTGAVKINAGVSYASANRDVSQFRLLAAEENFYDNKFNYENPVDLAGRKGFLVDSTRGFLHPSALLSVAKNETLGVDIPFIYDTESETAENELGANLDFEFDWNITDAVKLNMKLGGKYKHKERDYDFEGYTHANRWAMVDYVRSDWYDRLTDSPYLEPGYSPSNLYFPYGPFIDRGYDSGRFMNGNYEINRVPDIDMVREFVGGVDRVNTENAFGLIYDYNQSWPNDYHGKEDYFAAYIKPGFHIGQSITLIPGFRFEHNRTRYTGYRTSALGQFDEPFAVDTVTTTRSNNYLLPMIHTKIQVADWFDVRASYTQTISRPSYQFLIPRWTVIPTKSLNWNNPNLDPIESENIDVQLSFYSKKLGLVTLGFFSKQIDNFIYNQTTYLVDSSLLLDVYPDIVALGGQVTGNINNPNTAELYGFEFDWQSNFWFLPGLWKNVVFNVNYTYTHSELVYPMIRPEFTTNWLGISKLTGSYDASFKAPLIDQPDHLVNLSLGYDYQGFSIRGSMRYKADIFLANNFYPELRQYTDPITLYDLTIKQDLPIDGLSLYLNANNLSRAIDTNTNQGTGWFTNREYYGLTMDVGLKYAM